jgi:hypothetical protein
MMLNHAELHGCAVGLHMMVSVQVLFRNVSAPCTQQHKWQGSILWEAPEPGVGGVL